MTTQPDFTLYEGEQSKILNNHPVVYKYLPGNDPSKPLVAFVPGMAHNARISYGGHEGYRSEDFLSHWFNKRGYGFLGISYPLDTDPPMMPTTSPDFTIPEWGHQAAAAINLVITENNLPRSVIVLAWSMGGKILHPVTVEAKRLEIEVKLFVSLAATPALPGLLTAVSKTHLDKTAAGYATKPFLEQAFLRQIDEQDKLNHAIQAQDTVIQGTGPHLIIDHFAYKSDYLGATPIGITASGFRYDAEAKDFVKEDNEWQFMEDGQAHDYGNLPAMGAIYPTSALDFRHALTDKSTWSFLMIQRLTAKLTQDGTARSYHYAENGSEEALWSSRFRFEGLQRVVLTMPQVMTTDIMGNHFFFLGRHGAKQTVETVVGFLHNLVTIEQDIEYELSSV
jgi:pimeloyl-ACP methyl ester carboxylesterase